MFEKYSEIKDPLKAKKEEQNQKALDIYPDARELIQKSKDPMVEALKLAIWGNSIDSMVNIEGFLDERIAKLLHESWIELFPLSPQKILNTCGIGLFFPLKKPSQPFCLKNRQD